MLVMRGRGIRGKGGGGKSEGRRDKGKKGGKGKLVGVSEKYGD